MEGDRSVPHSGRRANGSSFKDSIAHNHTLTYSHSDTDIHTVTYAHCDPNPYRIPNPRSDGNTLISR